MRMMAVNCCNGDEKRPGGCLGPLCQFYNAAGANISVGSPPAHEDILAAVKEGSQRPPNEIAKVDPFELIR